MKKPIIILGLAVFAILACCNTILAQMKYEKGILNFNGDVSITSTGGSVNIPFLETVTLRSSSMFIGNGSESILTFDGSAILMSYSGRLLTSPIWTDGFFTVLDADNFRMKYEINNATYKIMNLETFGPNNVFDPAPWPPPGGWVVLGGLRTTGEELTKSAFVTQSVANNIPWAVSEDDNGRKGTDYGAILVVLVKAFQEQNERIEQLEAEVAALKNQ